MLLGKLPIDNEEEIFKKGMDYSSLCAKGIHPKEYEREQARIEEEKELGSINFHYTHVLTVEYHFLEINSQEN